jgi:hypothetical protein
MHSYNCNYFNLVNLKSYFFEAVFLANYASGELYGPLFWYTLLLQLSYLIDVKTYIVRRSVMKLVRRIRK